mmetsp:Transcript_40914/g.102217  ORF Transcript_40914/g.102217 Transcript_40914/m.102217 type:complete len:244 (+) Transcript_40914:448-1179(+)
MPCASAPSAWSPQRTKKDPKKRRRRSPLRMRERLCPRRSGCGRTSTNGRDGQVESSRQRACCTSVCCRRRISISRASANFIHTPSHPFPTSTMPPMSASSRPHAPAHQHRCTSTRCGSPSPIWTRTPVWPYSSSRHPSPLNQRESTRMLLTPSQSPPGRISRASRTSPPVQRPRRRVSCRRTTISSTPSSARLTARRTPSTWRASGAARRSGGQKHSREPRPGNESAWRFHSQRCCPAARQSR